MGAKKHEPELPPLTTAGELTLEYANMAGLWSGVTTFELKKMRRPSPFTSGSLSRLKAFARRQRALGRADALRQFGKALGGLAELERRELVEDDDVTPVRDADLELFDDKTDPG